MPTMTPKVSVIMSTFRRNHGDNTCPNLLRRAIESVLMQTFTDFEFVLIDDCSTDGSEQVCREYEAKDKRVRFFRFSKNSGRPAMRYNDGMKLSRGNLFMFMFDDDMWFPNAIQDMYSAICLRNDCGMVYGQAEFVNSKTGDITRNFGAPWDYNRIKQRGNFLCNFAVIVRRNVINQLGGYDESPVFRRLCDWDLWVRIGEKFQVALIEKTIGRCFHSLSDSIGITVPLTDADMDVIRQMQSKPRNVYLKGQMQTKTKICFVYTAHDATLRRWSMSYLSNALNEEGFDSTEVDVRTPQGKILCEAADFIVFYRTHDSHTLNFMKRLKSIGKTVLYSIDDYLFQPNCKVTNDLSANISPYFQIADAVVSPNAKLLEKIPVDVPKILRRNVLDTETISLLKQSDKKSVSGVFNIGWLAGLNRREMDSFISRVLHLIDAGAAEGEHFNFFCFGPHHLGTFRHVTVTEHPYFSSDDWKGLYNCYKSFSLDIVINPLNESDEFFHCKSELKYVEAGALGVPIIVSRVSPYTEIIREGENGFLASTPEEFTSQVFSVCRTEGLAQTVGNAAHEHVCREYESVSNARKFIADLLSLRGIPKQPLIEPVPLFELAKLECISKILVGPVVIGGYVEQTIHLLPPFIFKRFSVLGATYCRKVSLGAKYQIWKNGQKQREGIINPSIMIDNQWWSVDLQELQVNRNDILTLRLINSDHYANLAFYCCQSASGVSTKIGIKSVSPIAIRFN